ncbi:hypothetical protein E2C01_083812 [Portunus trituberculatus]|uniref:Uncharacterized protein n=1 Tax=Portunus trituberculatus TaxID=210409 RepID=A0A5B7J2M5_PORTR|nr:hypothetical protein [Portunus trituberculatus]
MAVDGDAGSGIVWCRGEQGLGGVDDSIGQQVDVVALREKMDGIWSTCGGVCGAIRPCEAARQETRLIKSPAAPPVHVWPSPPHVATQTLLRQ